MTMLESLVAGIAISILSSLAFIAYKHPLGFRRIEFPLCGVVVVLFFCFLSYDIGWRQGVSEKVAINNEENASLIRPSTNIPSVLIVTAITFGTLIYLVVLSFLHDILGIDSRNNSDTKTAKR